MLSSHLTWQEKLSVIFFNCPVCTLSSKVLHIQRTLRISVAKSNFFSNPFHLFHVFFVLAFFPSFDLGNCQKQLFLEPFSFFFIFFHLFFVFLFVLACFPSFAFKIDLGNCQKELFLEPFSLFFHFFFVFFSHFFVHCFFVFFISFFIFFFRFSFFFHFIFHFLFFSFPFSFRFSFSFFSSSFSCHFSFSFFSFSFSLHFKFIFAFVFIFRAVLGISDLIKNFLFLMLLRFIFDAEGPRSLESCGEPSHVLLFLSGALRLPFCSIQLFESCRAMWFCLRVILAKVVVITCLTFPCLLLHDHQLAFQIPKFCCK